MFTVSIKLYVYLKYKGGYIEWHNYFKLVFCIFSNNDKIIRNVVWSVSTNFCGTKYTSKESCHLVFATEIWNESVQWRSSFIDSNVKEAYSCTVLLQLSRSDHNLVLLSPSYKPVVQQQPSTVRTMRKWSPGTMGALRGVLETTDWDALYQSHVQNIDGIVDCVSVYVRFCMDNTIPTKVVHPGAGQNSNVCKPERVTTPKRGNWRRTSGATRTRNFGLDWDITLFQRKSG